MAELHFLFLVKGATVANTLDAVRGSMADINVTYATLDDGDDFRDRALLDGLILNLCLSYCLSVPASSDTLWTKQNCQ